ncbi:sugar transferase [Mycolicibacterium fluoranthenivorans]|uniref:Undecaprenyl-phosphate galactose phosphotransferase, WbaP/exopolysaccharide biosynthesis polyprenyl glycosylphosphotransferase n=1 Tax=Mycolicibacterium fluoranthenivorans TaxID=258505 RepID=A0A1G4VJR2_9MYCO|nr:Undecaprenyl-phosphate galactose phosphotransferase, WbaP/exopolysaccharide biosynthesis polyprenyl glycosylphosphotransferase [Mycolicibacterium fluoranthenivorans]
MAHLDLVSRDPGRPGIGAQAHRQDPSAGVRVDDGPTPAVRRRLHWQRRYTVRLYGTDVVAVAMALVLAQYVRFGSTPASPGFESHLVTGFSIVIAMLWLLALAGFHSRSAKIIGAGAEEYRRVVAASFATFGAMAIAELTVRIGISRGYLLVALPVGTAGLLLGRWFWRKVVARQRITGGCRTAVLALGEGGAVAHLVDELTHNPADGFHVVGVCVHGYGAPRAEYLTVGARQIPILGDETHALHAIRTCGADTVALADTGHFGVQPLRRLVWELDPMGVDLMVSPGVVDVALSRLMMRPVAGLPLLQIEKPQYRGAKRFQKRAFDFCFALAALTAAMPILLTAAMAIKLSSRGPVFYRSERIGIDGRPFPMLKFRSMVHDADSQFESLMAKNESDGPLFKIREDPRVTPVGRVLRRLSIDELPQFINVLRQEMSVVGPRPPLRREVEAYDSSVLRRLLVKPGITGLWQVSGRSDLSWDRSVRLDLSYVDNWSMVGDVVIIVKTLRAVCRREGAY